MDMIDVLGLDEELDDRYIYIHHYTKPEYKYKISLKNLTALSDGKTDQTFKSDLLHSIMEADSSTINNEENAIKIYEGTYEAFMFVVHYFDYYNNIITEYKEPKFPLDPALSLKDIFGDEYIIFKELVEFNQNNENDKFEIHRRVLNVIHMANYMSMKKLLYKLCAIESSLIMHVESSDERQQLEDYLKDKKNC